VKIASDPASLAENLKTLRRAGKRIGFVPTMGNLHDGHLSLVDYANTCCDAVVVSIFVNPKQFGPSEDLDGYPRTLDADLAQLAARDAALVFTPTIDGIYPEGVNAHTTVSVPGLTDVLCGASRPGHFDGVSTVVCKLLNMVAPDVAVFGQKDLQQLLLIQKMVKDLAMSTQIVGMPTTRAGDGLALSSRNGYLSADERATAPTLYKTLQAISANILGGDRNYQALCADGRNTLEQAGFAVDYLEVRRCTDLATATASDAHVAVFVAAKLGNTRLIDNIQLDLLETPAL
jgi:pantoate--beta-alanine ligase